MGKGHPKLIGWDSEKDVTLNMEDALFSKESLQILTGSQFSKGAKPVHKKEQAFVNSNGAIELSEIPLKTQNFYLAKSADGISDFTEVAFTLPATPTKTISLTGATPTLNTNDSLIVDYYYEAPATTQSIAIASDLFPGTYRLEGTTFWRNEDNVDVVANYTIPKLKIMTGFSITMASSGDPVPFAFNCEVLKDSKSTSMVIIDVLE